MNNEALDEPNVIIITKLINGNTTGSSKVKARRINLPDDVWPSSTREAPERYDYESRIKTRAIKTSIVQILSSFDRFSQCLDILFITRIFYQNLTMIFRKSRE